MRAIAIAFCLLSFISVAFAAPGDFERLLPILTKEINEQEILPKTTQELKELFQDSETQLPRVFVKRLPDDFAKQGNKKLYAKILTALILRENEKILNERVLFLLLKEKFDKGEKWTDQEEAYFNFLVNKYDSSVLKTVSTKINDLIMKIDEIPPSLAVFQSALETDFGKKNLLSPFGQQGWLDDSTYAPIRYTNLSDAVHAYVQEMNSTPNYEDFHRLRAKYIQKQTPKGSFYMAQGLRTYRPENTSYIEKIRHLMGENSFVFQMDKINFKRNK